MNKQLQKDLSLNRKACVHTEARARSSDLIGQECSTEVPVVAEMDSFKEVFQSVSLL